MSKIIKIDLKSVAYNYRQIVNSTPKKVICVVKTDAYGHGAKKLANIYQSLGCDFFAVLDLNEAVILRQCGIKGNILIMGYTPPKYADTLYKFNLTQSLIDFDYAKHLQQKLYSLNKCLNCHIKIDTGMHRFGFDYKSQSFNIVKNYKNIKITGLYTHFSNAYEKNSDITKNQYDRFLLVKKNYFSKTFCHASNTFAATNYPKIKEDAIRVGLMLYGYAPNLKPLFTLQTKIACIKELNFSDALGYGLTPLPESLIRSKNIKIGIVPIGYADGFNPQSGKFYTKICGEKCFVVGRCCMNHSFIILNNVNIGVGANINLVTNDNITLLSKAQNKTIYQTVTSILLGNKKQYIND